MANIADCSVCIAKADLDKLDGAIRKAKEGERTYYCYRATCTDKGGNEHTIVQEWLDGWRTEHLLIDGKKSTHDELHDRGYVGPQWKTISDIVVYGGWYLDWQKLQGYSYQMDTWISEGEDYIRIGFGGRWDFPQSLADHLNNTGVSWQGAALDDAMDWSTTELGNADFGLAIVQDEEPWDIDENGKEYYGHHIEVS